jgi:hypothetical protein
MDRYPGGYFPVDPDVGPNTSSQSLNDPHMMTGSVNMHDEYAIASDDFQGYHQQQQQQQQVLPSAAFMMPNVPESHHRFTSVPAPPQSFNYFGPSGAPMFYNMVPQQIWQPVAHNTHEAHIEGNCGCSYCVAPSIPNSNELPHIIVDQSTGPLPVMNVSASAADQYPPVLPPATVHFQQFYSSAMGGHETEEIAIANMQQHIMDKPAVYVGGDVETAEH